MDKQNRVNQEVSRDASSAEAKALIEEQGLDGEQLRADSGGGFRLRVTSEWGVLAPFSERLSALMGTEGRAFRRNENLWVKPDRRSVVIRDHTVVGDGVPPHVDGKDATLLVYLADVAEGAGGATVFPELGISVRPVKGTAMLYWSDKDLLHYSEAVQQGGKWIMQLLIDFK
ncbi:unnamed protein product [Phaeothamnion confervicola]